MRRVEPYGPIDVLQRSFAEIVEGEFGLSPDLLKCIAGQIDPARCTLVLNSSGDIDAIAKQVVAVDNDITDVEFLCGN